MGAVGNYPLTVDNEQQYRPQESPAKRYITDCAVDAGGTLQRLSSTFSPIVTPYQLQRIAMTLTRMRAHHKSLPHGEKQCL
jgi:hypothetical protein